MSRYTTSLADIVYNLSIGQELPSLDAKINFSLPYIFDFDFPFYKESERTNFEKGIVTNFLFNEICSVPYENWKWRLNAKLNLIMPTYNDLLSAYDTDFEIFENYNVTETANETTNENNVGNIKSTSNQTTSDNSTTTTNNLSSDTPQANYSNLDYATNLNEGKQTYQDNVNSNGDTSSDTSTERNQTKTNTITRKGLAPGTSNSKLLAEYQNTIKNIYKLIYSDMRDLFMAIY